MQEFSSLGLSQPTLDAIEELGFESPTSIQAGAIPKLLNNESDFIGLAQTGTGKTAAFATSVRGKLHRRGLLRRSRRDPRRGLVAAARNNPRRARVWPMGDALRHVSHYPLRLAMPVQSLADET